MRQVKRIVLWLLLPIMFAGCASGWKITGTKFKNPHYLFTPPPNWMMIYEGTSTILSKHGPSLERILIFRNKVTDQLPFTNLQIYPEMLPHELGEVILSRIIAAPQVSNVCLLEESVSEIDSIQAVRLTIEYQIDAIGFTDLIYAFTDGLFLYELRYTAAKRHYYGESISIFETLVKSFRLR